MGSCKSKDSNNPGSVMGRIPHPPPCSPCCQCCHKWMDSYPVMIEELLSRYTQRLEYSIGERIEELLSQYTQRLEYSIDEKIQNAVDKLGHNSCSSSVPHDVKSSASRSLKLRFKGTFVDEIVTQENIIPEGAQLMVELLDNSGSKVEVKGESSVKIEIMVLDGDFEFEDNDDWTADEFEKKVAQSRKGRPPLLKGGKCEILMENGVAVLTDVSFTDNSKCVAKNGWFRLGAKVVKGLPKGVEAREAISKPFQVKERRGKSKPLSLEASPQRLKHIGKILADKLLAKNIRTVKDFLQLYHADEQALKHILELPENKWRTVVDEAKSCPLTQEFDCERYRYSDVTSGVELELDCVFRIKRATFNGKIINPYSYRDNSEKELVNRIRLKAYHDKQKKLQKSHAPTSMTLKQDDDFGPTSTTLHPSGQHQGVPPLRQYEFGSTSRIPQPSGQDQGMERGNQDIGSIPASQTHHELHEKPNQVEGYLTQIHDEFGRPSGSPCPSSSQHPDATAADMAAALTVDPIISMQRGAQENCSVPACQTFQGEEGMPHPNLPSLNVEDVERWVSNYNNEQFQNNMLGIGLGSSGLPVPTDQPRCGSYDPLSPKDCFTPIEKFIDHIGPSNHMNNGQDPPQSAHAPPKEYMNLYSMDEDSEFNSSSSKPQDSNQPFDSSPIHSSRKRLRPG